MIYGKLDSRGAGGRFCCTSPTLLWPPSAGLWNLLRQFQRGMTGIERFIEVMDAPS